jgi:phage shock protein E
MDNIFLVIGAVSIGIGGYLKYEHNYKHASKITPKVAKRLIACGGKVLDVRSKGEFNLGSVTRTKEGETKTIAIHIPGGEITEETLKKNGFEKSDTIIAFCNSGTRARKAADKLIKLGYVNTFYIVETYKSLQE